MKTRQEKVDKLVKLIKKHSNEPCVPSGANEQANMACNALRLCCGSFRLAKRLLGF